MDFLIHWPPGPVVATVQCQGLQGRSISRERAQAIFRSVRVWDVQLVRVSQVAAR